MKKWIFVWVVSWELTKQVLSSCPETLNPWTGLLPSTVNPSILCWKRTAENKSLEFLTKQQALKFIETKPKDSGEFTIRDVQLRKSQE